MAIKLRKQSTLDKKVVAFSPILLLSYANELQSAKKYSNECKGHNNGKMKEKKC